MSNCAAQGPIPVPKLYRWGCGHEWLRAKIAKHAAWGLRKDVHALKAIALTLMDALPCSKVQVLFQGEMHADGFFEPYEGAT